MQRRSGLARRSLFRRTIRSFSHGCYLLDASRFPEKTQAEIEWLRANRLAELAKNGRARVINNTVIFHVQSL